MESNFDDIPQSYKQNGQAPLDAKSMVTFLSELEDLGTGNNKAFTYHRGMVVYCHETKKRYEWTDQGLVGNPTKLLLANFIYPNGSNYDSEDYSGKAFNFIEQLQAKDIVIPAVPLTDLENEGTGVDVYNGMDGNTAKIARLNSNNILIEKELDGSIKLTAPNQTAFTYLTAFYVNSAYVPTPTAPADGSIIRPFPTYDEAKEAFIGTGSVHSPQFANGAIILQTSSSTVNNPSVNNLTIQFENGSLLSYDGNDDYMFDTEVILASSGQLPENFAISMVITGNGSITRRGLISTKVGLIRALGSNRTGIPNLSNPIISKIQLAPFDTDNIILIERPPDYYPAGTWTGDLTYPNGVNGHTGETLESYYGTPHKYSLTLTPGQHLIYVDYYGFIPFSYALTMGGEVIISTLTHAALYIGAGVVTLPIKKLNISIVGNYITTTSATKLVSNPYVYAHHSNRNLIETHAPFYINQGGALRYNGLGEYSHTSINSFIKVLGSNFNIDAGYIEAFSRAYFENFIEYDNVLTNNAISLKNNLDKSSIIVSQGQTFIKTSQPNFTIYAPNTDITSFKKLVPITTIGKIETLGTLSTFNDKPIQTLPQYASKAAAKAAGLTSGSLFVKVTNVDADDLQSGVEYKVQTSGSPSLGAVGSYFTATGLETGTGVAVLYTKEILI